MRKSSLSIALTSLYLLCQAPLYPANADPDIYKTGTKFILIGSWWGMSTEGTMEILGDTEVDGRDLILVRYQVTKMGGLLGFLARFLRIYKGSNTFDSYIDPDTHKTVKYEIYKLKDDGSRKINDNVYFDRKRNRIVSLEDNRPVISNVPPDVQDSFAIFLELLLKVNTEELFLGKVFKANLYAYGKFSKLEIKVTNTALINGAAVYTLGIEKLPVIFKHPVTISFNITDAGEGLMLPTSGKCIIHLRILPDIKLNGYLRKVRYSD